MTSELEAAAREIGEEYNGWIPYSFSDIPKGEIIDLWVGHESFPVIGKRITGCVLIGGVFYKIEETPSLFQFGTGEVIHFWKPVKDPIKKIYSKEGFLQNSNTKGK
jgi:hypothetical protein